MWKKIKWILLIIAILLLWKYDRETYYVAKDLIKQCLQVVKDWNK